VVLAEIADQEDYEDAEECCNKRILLPRGLAGELSVSVIVRKAGLGWSKNRSQLEKQQSQT